MEELIAAIISFLIEVFGEVVLQLVAEFGIDLIGRWIRNLRSDSPPWSPAIAAIGYSLLGMSFGAVSIFVAPHALVKPSRVHGISLLISPLITGLIMSQIGAWIRRRDRQSARIESFAYGATFAFGVALVRFFWLR